MSPAPSISFSGTDWDESTKALIIGEAVHGFEYDAAGNIVARVDPLGHRTVYRCDPVGRVLTKSLADGQIARFGYDATGNRILTQCETATARRRFDAENRLVEEQLNDFTIQHEYDAGGNIIATRNSHGHVVANTYDLMGRVTAISIDERPVIALSRDPAGHVIAEALGDRLRETYRYDGEGRLQRQELRDNSRPILSRSYAYDLAGNLLLRDDSRKGPVTYRYDERGHVIAWRSGTGPEVGVDRVIRPSLQSSDVGNDGGWRTIVNGVECEYDAAGNLLRRTESKREQHFEWTNDNKLAAVRDTDGRAVVRMEYDAQGRRISKEHSDEQIGFYWDQNRLIADSGGSEGPTQVPSTILGHSCRWRRSILPGIWRTSSATTTVSCRKSAAVTATSSGQRATGRPARMARWMSHECRDPLRFPGQYADADTGLRSTRFRYLDPEVNAFVSPDPIGLLGGHDLYRVCAESLGVVGSAGTHLRDEHPAAR